MSGSESIGRVGYLVIVATVVCLIIVIALQSATLHETQRSNEQGVDGKPGASASVKLSLTDELRLKFPGVFYTPSEFAETVSSFKNFSQTTGNTSRISSFTPICIGTYCKIELDEYHTCCCVSKSSFDSPTTAVDINGVNRTLAQFNGVNQYFYTENCEIQPSSCINCACTPVPVLASGVYNINATAGEYGVAFFRIGTLCKDLNT